jgi:hypothetical protein
VAVVRPPEGPAACLKAGFMDFGKDLSCLANSLLLSLVYLIGVGATAAFARLAGKRFIGTSKGSASYWSALDLGRKPPEDYLRQF